MDNSYIVRIYKNETNNVIGVVEDIETHERGKFTNAQELWNQLSIEHKKVNRNVKLNLIM